MLVTEMISATPAAQRLGASVVAHRGVHGEGVEENSIESFEMAIRHGFAIELDLFFTTSGVTYVHHGPSTTSAARKLMAEAPTGMPTSAPALEEMLAFVDGRTPLLVEFKYVPLADALAYGSALRALGAYCGPFVVMSFDKEILASREALPNVPFGYITLGLHSPPKGLFDFVVVQRTAYHLLGSRRHAEAPVGLWTFPSLDHAVKDLKGTSMFGMADITAREIESNHL